MGFVDGRVEKIGRLHPFADEASLHVGHGHDDRVDVAAAGEFCELVEGDHAGHWELLMGHLFWTDPVEAAVRERKEKGATAKAIAPLMVRSVS
jgi:hypothetical protein